MKESGLGVYQARLAVQKGQMYLPSVALPQAFGKGCGEVAKRAREDLHKSAANSIESAALYSPLYLTQKQ